MLQSCLAEVNACNNNSICTYQCLGVHATKACLGSNSLFNAVQSCYINQCGGLWGNWKYIINEILLVMIIYFVSFYT